VSTAAEDLVRRHSDEVINGQRIDQVDALFQADVTFRDPAVPGGVIEGVAAYKQVLAASFAAIPDLRFTVDAVLGDEAHVSWRGRLQGTQGGRPLDLPLAEFYQLQEGKIQQAWVYLDMLTLTQQLGAVPTA
jgi:predicted ester cyclase